MVSVYIKLHLPNLPRPGQFLMIWVPDAEEVPMSVSGAGRRWVRISVLGRGKTTSKIQKLRRGDLVGVRGPFGRGFSLKGKSHLLVGGGSGVAALIYASKTISDQKKECVFLIGAKTSSELPFLREVKRLNQKLLMATEDGSAGYKGVVTDLVEPILIKKDFDSVMTCGPEKMMVKTVELALKHGVRVQASLERYMKCGFGVCGSCVLDPVGLRVCTDGPVFDGRILLQTDFGKFKRDAAGRRRPI